MKTTAVPCYLIQLLHLCSLSMLISTALCVIYFRLCWFRRHACVSCVSADEMPDNNWKISHGHMLRRNSGTECSSFQVHRTSCLLTYITDGIMIIGYEAHINWKCTFCSYNRYVPVPKKWKRAPHYKLVLIGITLQNIQQKCDLFSKCYLCHNFVRSVILQTNSSSNTRTN